MIQRWKHPTIASHLIGVLQGFAEIADGLVTVGSLGFYMSGFEMRVASYRTLKHMRSLKARTKPSS